MPIAVELILWVAAHRCIVAPSVSAAIAVIALSVWPQMWSWVGVRLYRSCWPCGTSRGATPLPNDKHSLGEDLGCNNLLVLYLLSLGLMFI